MNIELERAHTPEDVGREADCAICARHFRTEVVLAKASTEDGAFMGMGLACPDCVGALGAYRRDWFPTLEEYESAVARFGEAGPIWEDLEAADVAWKQEAPHRAALEASRIERTALPSAESSG